MRNELPDICKKESNWNNDNRNKIYLTVTLLKGIKKDLTISF